MWICWDRERRRFAARRCKAHAGVEIIKSWEFTTASLLYRHSANHAPAVGVFTVWCLLSASNVWSQQWPAQGPLASCPLQRGPPGPGGPGPGSGSGTDPPAYQAQAQTRLRTRTNCGTMTPSRAALVTWTRNSPVVPTGPARRRRRIPSHLDAGCHAAAWAPSQCWFNGGSLQTVVFSNPPGMPEWQNNAKKFSFW